VVAGSSGLAVARDPARAERLAELAAAGETAWRANFGDAPARYVVFESGTPPEVARDRSVFVQAGYPVALPWSSPEAWLAGQRRMIETRVREQMQSMGMGEQQISEALTRMQTEMANRNTPELAEAREVAGVPHELGHQWFVAAVSPSERAGPEHTGGPAADWIDEAAAQLAEPIAAADRRREQFRRSRSADAPLVSLEALLAGPPVGGVVRMGSGRPGGAPVGLPPGASVMTSGAPPTGAAVAAGGPRMVFGGPGGGQPGAFGAIQPVLTRIFLDYVAARSGGPGGAVALIRGTAGDGDLARWLAAEGASHGLPTSSEALEADWRAWVAETYPPAS